MGGKWECCPCCGCGGSSSRGFPCWPFAWRPANLPASSTYSMYPNPSCPSGYALPSSRVASTRTWWAKGMTMAPGTMDSSRSAIVTGVRRRIRRSTMPLTSAMWTARACWARTSPWPSSVLGASRGSRAGRPGPCSRSSAMVLWRPSTSAFSRAMPPLSASWTRSEVVRVSGQLCHHCRKYVNLCMQN